METTLRDETGECIDGRGDYWERVTLPKTLAVSHTLAKRLNRAKWHGGNAKAIMRNRQVKR